MTLRRVHSRKPSCRCYPAHLSVRAPAAQQDKVAALKQSLAANQKQLKQYKWVETTVISMKGEEKSRIQKQCFYGPDGKVQKQQLSAPRGRVGAGRHEGQDGREEEGRDHGRHEAGGGPGAGLRAAGPAADPGRENRRRSRDARRARIRPPGPSQLREEGDTFSLGLDTAPTRSRPSASSPTSNPRTTPSPWT